MTRAALLSLVLLTVPTPARAQDDPPAPVKTTTRTCGTYTLTVRENGFGDPLDRVTVRRGGAVAVTVEDTMVEVGWCRDVTGDGVPEVLLTGFSGGAHCCFTQTLLSLTTPPRRLLSAFTAHTDSLEVQQLDGRGPLELVGADWRFAYAYGLSFAESAPLPVVYSYLPVADGPPVYVEHTRAFPDFMQAFARSVNSGPERFGGGVLVDYATRVVTQGAAEADTFAAAQPAADAAWLASYGPDIRAALNDVGLRDWPTRAGASPDAPRGGLGGAFSAPGTREYLALVGRPGLPDGGAAGPGTVRLYRPQGADIVASAPLQTVPMTADPGGYVDSAWWPAFAVRRAGGRDDVVVRDARSGSVRYTAHRASMTALDALTDDPLAVAATLLGDLSSVAQHVAGSHARPTPPRTPAQQAEVQRRIDAAVARARPWAALTTAPLDLPRLGAFTVGALELPLDTADRARVTATAEIGYADEQTDSEYIFGARHRVTIDLTREGGGWRVSSWALAPLGGERSP